MFAQLAESWLINDRVMGQFISQLTPEALAATLSTRGGRNVGQQLVHVYQVRRSKIELANKTRAKGLVVLEREDGHDGEGLLEAFDASGRAIAEIVRQSAENEGHITGFKRGVCAWVGYLIAHDSHHRGHALLTMKQCKIKRPADLQMGLWGWNKI